MRILIILLVMTCSMSFFSCGEDDSNEFQNPGLPEGPSSERFTKFAKGTKYSAQGFWEYLPAAYGNGKQWPLMIFFHGLGENGNGSSDDLEKLLSNGPPRYINKDEWPIAGSSVGDDFIVLSIQNSSGGCHKPNETKEFINWAAAEYDVDVSRIYLTGLSCGAIGIWDYLKQNLEDNLVAAIVPIAGNGKGAWSRQGCNLGELPIWAFHGDADGTVNVSGTNIPLDGLAACSDPVPLDVKKTIYPGVGHNSWSQTYDLSAGHDIYAWFLSHSNDDASL